MLGQFIARLIIVLFEFWEVIITSFTLVPAIGIMAWFGFRNYLVLQNAWIETYKPTIDVIFAILGILIALNWLDAFKKQSANSDARDLLTENQSSSIGVNNFRIVCQDRDLNMRGCAEPSDSKCPVVATLPAGSSFALAGESKIYTGISGKNSTWVKIEYNNVTGWVNEFYTCKKNK